MKKLLLSGLMTMSLVGVNVVYAQDNSIEQTIQLSEIGAPVVIDVKDELISKVFGIIEQASGQKIVVAESIGDPNVTIKLNNVPWNMALEMIVGSSGLNKTEKDGKIYINQ